MSTLPPPSVAEQPTVEVFLKTVLRSGLLNNDQLQAALQGVPADRMGDVHFLSNHLVKIGRLSRFQAGKLIQGATLGLVLGPFHLLAPIGRGGMGAVYLARDSRNGKLLAVKVLPPKRAKAEERLLLRFKREMDICQRVDHPHLTKTFEVGSHENVHYIAMEYIPGKNLYRLVADGGPLTVGRAARLFCEVAIGLEYAHNMGLIHRDMKPSNLIVMPDDHAKVLDLGLALIQNEVAADRTVVGGAGYVVGTLDYLAPEQAEDAVNVDARSDIYGFGCTLYFALTRQAPFPGGNALQKLLKHRIDEPTSIAELNPTVPIEFARLISKMMAKKKEDRYANAGELRAALAPFAEAGPAPLTASSTRMSRPAPAAPDTASADLAPEPTPEPSPKPPKPRLVPPPPRAAAEAPKQAPPAKCPEPAAARPAPVPPPPPRPEVSRPEPAPKPAEAAETITKPLGRPAAGPIEERKPAPVPAPSAEVKPATPPSAAPPSPVPPPERVETPINPPPPAPVVEEPSPFAFNEVPMALAMSDSLDTTAPMAVLVESKLGEAPVVASTDVPFWLDYAVPVGASSLVLGLIWLLAARLFLQK